MNASPKAIHEFRENTNKLKGALNFPKMRDCQFCGQPETRTLMRHNRCRACNKARP